MIKEVNIEEFSKITATGVTFVDFYATWCGPCKMLAPFVDAVSEEITDVNFIKVDVDKQEELAHQFQVMSIPTLVIIKDGKIVSKKMGFMPKEQLSNWINENK